jgi:glycogen phosphorylase
MRPVARFTIVPSLPERIERLRDLALNLWWSWEHEAIDLLRRIDPDLWEIPDVYHNPIKILSMVPQRRLVDLSEDEGFLAQYDRVIKWLDSYMEADAKGTTWFRHNHPEAFDETFSYFCSEFGLNECIPVYSGGLGLLAGDHLKSASDLGVPLVAVGMLYQQGYFRQYLNNDGWQQEAYPINDFYSMPLELMRDEKGQPITVDVEYPGRTVRAQIWKVQVGRVPLYLLDTNVDHNAPPDRDITDQLYGGDIENRIKQEVMLGIGGARALEALGIESTVRHMNEGHSVFLALERIRKAMTSYECSFHEAIEIVKSGTVFTTHTPVPAGNHEFPPETIDRYLGHYYGIFGISREEFLRLGQVRQDTPNAPFGLTVLAIRLASHTNGVSKLHGAVARAMWQPLWPGLPENEVPITSITNGVHTRSWLSQDLAWVLARYVGSDWMERPDDHSIWERISRVPDEELWRSHERRREKLVAFARQRLTTQLKRRGATRREVAGAGEVLDPEVLTIGFARRFATYKRATLLLRDPDRIIKLLTDKDHPVQFIFAGKAHPADTPGKEFIRKIVQFVRRRDDLRRRVVFLEDYDINVARYMVQGVDIWLNTPRRPLEASGTSGMKAAMNGALNLSILDGWWEEAYEQNPGKDIGWAIGRGESYSESETEYQDEVESCALFDLLEQEVVPTFYARDSIDLPRTWIHRMKTSMINLCPEYNTNRMVQQYTEWFYLPSAKRWQEFTENKHARAIELAAWKMRIREAWGGVSLVSTDSDGVMELPVGNSLEVRARVDLGKLTPDDVAVEIYHGRVDSQGEIVEGQPVHMRHMDGKSHNYVGEVPARGSGLHGYAIRVIPRHPELNYPNEMGLILWSS